MDFDKLGETVKSHPVLFTCIGAAVAVYFLWPASSSSGANSSAISASEAASIAAASQANAQLTVAQDQVNATLGVAGLQAATAQTINAQNSASSDYIAGLQAGVATDQLTTALSGAQLSADSATTLAADTLASQNSAQAFLTTLMGAGYNTPAIQVAGLNAGSNIGSIQETNNVNVAAWAINGGGAFISSAAQPAPGVYNVNGTLMGAGSTTIG